MRISSTPSIIMSTTHWRCQLGQLQELGQRNFKKYGMGLFRTCGYKKYEEQLLINLIQVQEELNYVKQGTS